MMVNPRMVVGCSKMMFFSHHVTPQHFQWSKLVPQRAADPLPVQAQRLEDPRWTLARYVPRVPTSFVRKKGVEMTRAPSFIIFSESICTYIPHLSIYFIRFWRVPRMTTEPATSDAMPSQPHPAPVQHFRSSVQEPLWTYPQQRWSVLEIGGWTLIDNQYYQSMPMAHVSILFS